jgi:hypothetical protein
LRSVSAILFWSDILSSASAKSGISTFLQLLQLGISVMSLQLLWYFVFSSVSAIWYLRSVSTIFFWSDILSPASAKSGISSFLQPLPWHLLPKRLFGYIGYLLIWEFSFLILLLCIVTARVLFRLLTTRFFMSELSTLRSIVILLVIISSMTPLLCLLFLLPCRLQISLPRCIPSLVFVF